LSLRVFLLSAGGIGFLPPAPGTWASLAAGLLNGACLAGGLPLRARLGVLASVALFFSLVTYFLGGKEAQARGTRDPRFIVSDEVSGQTLALLPAGDLVETFVAFSLFRVLDVLKPCGIQRLEKLPGGAGILLDDLASGVATAFAVLAFSLVRPVV